MHRCFARKERLWRPITPCRHRAACACRASLTAPPLRPTQQRSLQSCPFRTSQQPHARAQPAPQAAVQQDGACPTPQAATAAETAGREACAPAQQRGEASLSCQTAAACPAASPDGRSVTGPLSLAPACPPQRAHYSQVAAHSRLHLRLRRPSASQAPPPRLPRTPALRRRRRRRRALRLRTSHAGVSDVPTATDARAVPAILSSMRAWPPPRPASRCVSPSPWRAWLAAPQRHALRRVRQLAAPGGRAAQAVGASGLAGATI